MAAPAEEEEDSRWSDWEEESDGEGGEGGGMRFLPLCVPSTSTSLYFGTAKEAIEHDAKACGFDVCRVVKELRAGFYECMK